MCTAVPVSSHVRARAYLWQGYVRGSFGGFRALGVRKLDALLPVLRAGVNVVLSDVDCVWSQSPLPMFHGQVRSVSESERGRAGERER
jgi:hypothetical protein